MLGQPAQYRWPVLSPDSTRIVFVRQDVEDKSQNLYVLERSTGVTIQLTSDATHADSPVWSPDGRQLAYVSTRGGSYAIYRKAATGTQPEELVYRLPGPAVLSDWSADGRYLAFSVIDRAPQNFGDPLGDTAELFLLRVGLDASNARPIAVPNGNGRRGAGGRFSPDGRLLAFRSDQSGTSQIWVAQLNDAGRTVGEPRQVSIDGGLGMATWRRDGRELYFLSADRELMALSLVNGATVGMPRRLFAAAETTNTFFISDYPFMGAPDGVGSISRDGREAVFVSRPPSRGAPFPKQLTVFDRAGKVVRRLDAPAAYSQPVFSPDGRKVAAYRNRALWVFDIASGQHVQITPGAGAYSVAWSPDSQDVAYASNRGNSAGLYKRSANGSGPQQLLYTHSEAGASTPLTDWSPDGRFFSFNGGNVLWTVSATGGKGAFLLPRAEFMAFGGRMSPDGRLLAYASDESGTMQIHVRQFDSSSGYSANDRIWQVSTDGGLGMVQWRRDGRELYYVARDGYVMAVDVSTAPSFQAGSPKRLFRLPELFPHNATNLTDCSCGIVGGCEQGHISRDGEKFIFAVPVPPQRPQTRLPISTLARYTGTYVLPGGGDVLVSLEGDHLILNRQGQEASLVAESENRFFLKTTNGDVEFFTDDNGNVSYFLFYTGGAPRLALRK
jgi:Tol biopolymer transport system component